MQGDGLNPAQWNVVFQARQEWLVRRKKGEGDDAALRAIAERIYGALGLAAPPVHRFGSPLAAMLAIPHLAAHHGLYTHESYLLTSLGGPLTSNLGTQSANVWTRMGQEFASPFDRPVKSQLSASFVDGFADRMGTLLRELGGDALAEGRLKAGLFGEIGKKTLGWWSGIVSASDCWWWPFTKFMVASDHPTAVRRDEDLRFHDEERPAVEFSDGCGIHAWHGVPVPEKVIVRPETITVEEVDGETNVEIRRAMIARMGAGTYLTKSGAELLDMDSLTLDGSAPRALMEDKHGNKWLVGTDGSTARVYTMAVPRGAQSCREAHMLIAGFDESRLIAEA